MAILDGKLELSDNQDLTLGSGSSAQSTNIIDLGAANLQLGAGTPLYLNVRMATAFAVAAATLTVALMTNTTTDVDGGTTIISRTVTAPDDWVLRISLPLEMLQRYIGLKYTIGTSTESEAYVDAWISLDTQSSYGISAEV